MRKRSLLLGMALMSSTGLVAADSLFVDATGNVGVGTNTPAASLNVVRTDGTAQVLVSDTGPAGPKTLFRLENVGNAKFGVANTEAGTEWSFANPGSDFRLSLQGSGVVEMAIDSSGNLTIPGALSQGSDVNSKTNIEKVDNSEILQKVSDLNISSWAYKKDPNVTHIGPMSQDFHAAFGVGNDDTRIAVLDASGVALAAIKALNEKLEAKEARIAALEEKLAQQQLVQERLQALEAVTVELMQESKATTIPAAYRVK